MRFSCESCQARYAIADEKARGKVLRVRCKRCNAVNTVDGRDLDPAVEGGDLHPEAQVPENVAAATAASPTSTPSVDRPWHIAIDGKEQGPFSAAQLEERIQSGMVTRRTWVWREGMGKWERLWDVTELRTLVEGTVDQPPPGASMPPPPRGSEPPRPAASALDSDGDSAERTIFASIPAGVAVAAAVNASAPRPASSDRAEVEGPTTGVPEFPASGVEPPTSVEAVVEPLPTAPAPALEALPPVAAPQESAPKSLDSSGPAANSGKQGRKNGRSSGKGAAPAKMASPAAVTETLPLAETSARGASTLDEALTALQLDTPASGSTAESVRTTSTPASPAVGPPVATDPFGAVAASPTAVDPEPGETTDALIKRTAARARSRSPWPLVAGLTAIGVGLVGVAVYQWKSTVEAPPAAASDASTTAGKAAGGTAQGPTELAAAQLDVLNGNKGGDKPSSVAGPAAGAAPRGPETDVKKKSTDGRKSAGGAAGDADLALLAAGLDQDIEIPKGATGKAGAAEATPEATPEMMAQLALIQGDKAGRGANAPKVFVPDDAAGDMKHVAGAGDGGLDPQVIAKRVTDVNPALNNCVTTAKKRNPDLKLGKVVVQLTIAPSGVVTRTEFSQRSLSDTDVGQCLRRVVKSMVFPAFDGEPMEVELPLSISAG